LCRRIKACEMKLTVLNEREKEHVAQYAYKAGLETPLDRALTPFWNECVKLLPLWLAPNTVTLSGLALVLASTANLALRTRSLKELAPWWCYYLAAGCLLAYQTLDAIDGKQARRTGSSSPLGQLFDHGCDAICTGCIVVLTMCGCFCGASWLPLATMHTLCLQFFTSQWEEYHTGILNISNGWLGVTEGQFILFTLLCQAPLTGPEFWRGPISDHLGLESAASLLQVTPTTIFVASLLLLTALGAAENIYKVLQLPPGGTQSADER